jgi:hypothetical protein
MQGEHVVCYQPASEADGGGDVITTFQFLSSRRLFADLVHERSLPYCASKTAPRRHQILKRLILEQVDRSSKKLSQVVLQGCALTRPLYDYPSLRWTGETYLGSRPSNLARRDLLSYNLPGVVG